MSSNFSSVCRLDDEIRAFSMCRAAIVGPFLDSVKYVYPGTPRRVSKEFLQGCQKKSSGNPFKASLRNTSRNFSQFLLSSSIEWTFQGFFQKSGVCQKIGITEGNSPDIPL